MKIYFDNIEDLDFLIVQNYLKDSNNGHWLTSSGTRLKTGTTTIKNTILQIR
jgi:hypothetical protein